MKFTISLKNLTEAVSNSNRAVALKGVKPILANLMITAQDNEIRIIGTDDELMIVSRISAEIEKNGNFTISSKLLSEVLNAFPDKDNTTVNLEITEEKPNLLVISSEKSEYDLQIQGIEEFPPVPVIENNDFPSFSMNAEILATTLKEGSIAVAAEGPTTHKSIYFDLSDEEEGPQVASLDGKRLAATGFDKLEIPSEMKKAYLLPSRSINEILKISALEEQITIGFFKEHLVFSNSKATLFTKIVDGKFPDYKRILPSEYTRRVTVNKKEFAQALKAVLPIARLMQTDVNIVNIDISQNEMKLWAESPQFGSSEIFIPCILEGEPINTTFDAGFVQSFISVVDDEEIILELTTPKYPGVLKPANPESKFKYVVMPVIFVM